MFVIHVSIKKKTLFFKSVLILLVCDTSETFLNQLVKESHICTLINKDDPKIKSRVLEKWGPYNWSSSLSGLRRKNKVDFKHSSTQTQAMLYIKTG